VLDRNGPEPVQVALGVARRRNGSPTGEHQRGEDDDPEREEPLELLHLPTPRWRNVQSRIRKWKLIPNATMMQAR
jgi:hypothetical protein